MSAESTVRIRHGKTFGNSNGREIPEFEDGRNERTMWLARKLPFGYHVNAVTKLDRDIIAKLWDPAPTKLKTCRKCLASWDPEFVTHRCN